MKTVITAIITGLAALFIGFNLFSSPQAPTYAELEQERLAVEHAQAIAPAWTIASWIVIVGGALLVVGLPAAWAFAALARFRNERRPDRAGRLPVLLSEQADYQAAAVAALAASIDVERVRASIQPVPHSIHYTHNPHNAPRLSIERGSSNNVAELPVLEESPALDVPSFAQLLDTGRIGKGQPITLGFDSSTGKPVETHWSGLYSSAIGGRQGSGKSWTAAGIIAQSVLNGARLAVCDIHAGDSESITNRVEPLASRFLFAPADSPQSVITTVKNVDAILQARSSGRDSSRDVVLLVFDEFTSTLRRLGQNGEAVANILANIASEGRKFGVFALLIGHNWTADSTGGSAVRDNLTSAMVHNLRSNEARMMTGLTASSLPSDTHSLVPGQFYLLPKSGEMIKVQSPYMQPSDMQRVGQLLLGDGSDSLYTIPQRPSSSAEGVELGSDTVKLPETYQKATAQNAVNIAVETVALVSPEAAEAQRLFFAEKLNITEIVYKLRGVKGNQGARYQQALSEVQELLRQGLGQGLGQSF